MAGLYNVVTGHPKDAQINAKLASKRTETQRAAYKIGKEIGSKKEVGGLRGHLVAFVSGGIPHMWAEESDPDFASERARMQRYADRDPEPGDKFVRIHSDEVRSATAGLYGVAAWDESKHPRGNGGRFV